MWPLFFLPNTTPSRSALPSLLHSVFFPLILAFSMADATKIIESGKKDEKGSQGGGLQQMLGSH